MTATNPTFNQTIVFCQGDSIMLYGNTYTQPTAFTQAIPSATGRCDTLANYTLEMLPRAILYDTLQLCPGTSITLGGSAYTQPGTVSITIPSITGGCDTLIYYTLETAAQPALYDTLQLCSGASVTLGDSTYSQAGIVSITIPSTTGGCDTLAYYNLQAAIQPTLYDTLLFCPDDTVFINGQAYTQPGTVSETIPSTTGGCDTLRNHVLQYLPQASHVTISCPPSQTVQAPAGANFIVFNYPLPFTGTDCLCGDANLSLNLGLPTGGNFPIGLNQVCYTAEDGCGTIQSCCFTVQVNSTPPSPDSACDIKTTNCLTYELLGISADFAQNRTYHFRVTNHCATPMLYTAFELPPGVVAPSPANNSTYTAPSGNIYDIRNPNYVPFYSIRFKSKSDSLASGQSDVFAFKLSAQSAPSYIHVTARLVPNTFYEAYLNVFNCPIENGAKPALRQAGLTMSAMQIYPNPTSGAIFVDLSAWEGQSVRLRVLDLQGREVWRDRTEAGMNAYPIQLGDKLSNGFFLFEALMESGERQVMRFFIEK